MKRILHNLWPGGRPRAVTLSYDDGVVEDRRLVEILNRHGLKGTFHLNSGTLGQEKKLKPDEIAAVYAGHEISAHSVNHPHLDAVPGDQLALEMLDDRRALEALAGYPVRGMSYPFGTYSGAIVGALPALGIEYARTVESHGRFHVPQDFLLWHPTCHHNHELEKKTDEFFALAQMPWRRPMALLYVWGHSYEFPKDDNWDLIERFAARVGAEKETVWAATNIEIVDYVNAVRRLKTDVAGTRVLNPSALPVWITWDGAPREIPAGALVSL